MNKYAIVKKGHHQYFLEEGAIVEIPHVQAPEGKDIEFDEVLAVGTKDDFILGTPLVKGAKVVAFVIKHLKGDKKYGFKYKAKSRYRKRWGYRNLYTRLRVKEVVVPSLEKSGKAEASEDKKAEKTNTKKAATESAK